MKIVRQIESERCESKAVIFVPLKAEQERFHNFIICNLQTSLLISGSFMSRCLATPARQYDPSWHTVITRRTVKECGEQTENPLSRLRVSLTALQRKKSRQTNCHLYYRFANYVFRDLFKATSQGLSGQTDKLHHITGHFNAYSLSHFGSMLIQLAYWATIYTLKFIWCVSC